MATEPVRSDQFQLTADEEKLVSAITAVRRATKNIESGEVSEASAAISFQQIVDQSERDDLLGVLSNWKQAYLTEQGDIGQQIGRDGIYSLADEGGEVLLEKQEFVGWLMSPAPFDSVMFGPSIEEDMEWRRQVNSLRAAASPAHLHSDLKQASLAVLGCMLPFNWSGQVHVQIGTKPGELKVNVGTDDNGIALLQRLWGWESTSLFVHRLKVIAAHAELNDYERAVHFARLREMSIRSDPKSSDEEKEMAKEYRKQAEGLAMLNDPTLQAAIQKHDEETDRKGPTMSQEQIVKDDTKKPPFKGNRALTAEIVSELWKGVAETGRMPWQTPYLFVPQVNGFTGKAYRGINRLVLAQRLNDIGGSADNRWFARGQIMGRQKAARLQHKQLIDEGKAEPDSKPTSMFMRKGELAVRVVFASRVETSGNARKGNSKVDTRSVADQVASEIDSRTSQGSESKSYFVMRRYPVWHASQLENCPRSNVVPRYAASDSGHIAQDALLDLVKRMGAIVTENPSAIPNMMSVNKRIVMPPAGNFNSEYSYLCTLAHEIAHLTGTSDMLNRRFVVACETGEYAMMHRDNNEQFVRLRAQEEMTAEIAATLMMGCLGHRYNADDDKEAGHQHADYVAQYLQVVQDDPTAFSVACANAERVVAYAIQVSPMFSLAAQESGHYVPAGEVSLDPRAEAEAQLSEASFELDLADLDIDDTGDFVPMTAADFEDMVSQQQPSTPDRNEQTEAALRDLGF